MQNQFKNGGFTPKTYQMFSVHTMPEKFKPRPPEILNLCLKKTRAGKSREYHDTIVFRNLRYQSVLRLH